VDVENVQGFDLQFTDVTYEVEMLADDLAWVAIKGDTGAQVIPNDFPLGPVLTRYLPDDWAADIDTELQTGSFASDFGLALVEADGKWYVGLTYTIAEAARRSAGEPFPQQQPFSEPQGAETAAQALEKAVLAFANIDLRGLVDVLAPGETAAFRRYAGLFMDDWDAAIADFRNAMDEASFTYSVDEVLTGSEQRGDDTVAWIEDIPRFSASIDAPDIGMFSVERDGDCLTIEIPREMIEALGPAFAGEIDFSEFDGRSCIESNPFGDFLPEDQADPLAGQEEFLYDMPAFGPLLERWLTIGDDASESGTANVHFEVIEVDGRWYVSPIGTMWRWLFVFTGTLDQDLIIEVGDDLQQSVDDPEAFARRFEEWAMEIDDGGLLDSLGLFAPFSEQTAGPMMMFGPEMLAPFAGAPSVLLVWDYDVNTVTNRIEELYGQGAVLAVIDPPDMHQMFSNLGPGATGGLSPEEFPHGIHLAALDVDTLVEIFNWLEVLDLFSAADLGLGNA
jgi:hypothetical protein